MQLYWILSLSLSPVPLSQPLPLPCTLPSFFPSRATPVPLTCVRAASGRKAAQDIREKPRSFSHSCASSVTPCKRFRGATGRNSLRSEHRSSVYDDHPVRMTPLTRRSRSTQAARMPNAHDHARPPFYFLGTACAMTRWYPAYSGLTPALKKGLCCREKNSAHRTVIWLK